MNQVRTILTLCRYESIISYEKIKLINKITKVKCKLIAGILANNGYKFQINKKDLPCLKIKIKKQMVIEFINRRIMLLENEILYVRDECNAILKFQIRRAEIDIKNIEENFQIICRRYVPIEYRIFLSSLKGTRYRDIKNTYELKNNCKIKETLIIMSIANLCNGKTNFKIFM
jgi:hypothetical protein